MVGFYIDNVMTTSTPHREPRVHDLAFDWVLIDPRPKRSNETLPVILARLYGPKSWDQNGDSISHANFPV